MTLVREKPEQRRARPVPAAPGRPVRLGLALVLLPLCAALLLLVLGCLPAHELRALGQRLAADGDPASMSAERLPALQRRLLLGGGYLLFCSALTLLFVRGSACSSRGPRPAELGRSLARFCRAEAPHVRALAGLTLLCACLGLLQLGKPISCDEAYTALYFASRSTLDIASHYLSPNNHVLHTLLAHASLRVFGDELWALRLPAWLASVASVPLAWLAARALFGRLCGLLAAGLIASSPYLLDVGTSARGYPLVNLCFLGLLALMPRLLQPEARRAWILFVALAAAGLWAVPVMAHPFCAVLVWLVLRARRDLHGAARRAFWMRLASASAAVALGSLLLYMPSFLLLGREVAFLSDFLRPELAGSDARLFDHLRGRAAHAWEMWSFGGPWLLAFVCACAFAGLVWGAPQARERARALALAGLSGPLLIVLATWRAPPARCFSFELMLLLCLAGCGLVAILERFGRGRAAALGWPGTLVLLTLVGSGVAGTLAQRGAAWRSPWYVGHADAREAALALRDVLTPRHRLAGIREERPALIYHWQRLTGAPLLAFYPFDPELRARLLLAPDMDAADAPALVDGVFLIDTGRGGLEPHEEALARSGFRRTTDVIQLAHSRLIRYEPARPRAPSAAPDG